MATTKATKTTEKKTTPVLTEETKETETPIVTETTSSTPTDKDLPKKYVVQFWKRVRPADPRFDELAGTIYWSDVKQDIIIEELANQYSSDIERFFGKPLQLPQGVFIPYSQPKEWVRNLHLAELIDNFYAVQFLEYVDETE